LRRSRLHQAPCVGCGRATASPASVRGGRTWSPDAFGSCLRALGGAASNPDAPLHGPWFTNRGSRQPALSVRAGVTAHSRISWRCCQPQALNDPARPTERQFDERNYVQPPDRRGGRAALPWAERCSWRSSSYFETIDDRGMGRWFFGGRRGRSRPPASGARARSRLLTGSLTRAPRPANRGGER